VLDELLGDVLLELLGDELDELLGELLLELLGDVLDELLGDELLELLLGFADDEELEALGALEDWLEFRFVELEELLGADVLPFTLMSVEFDELLGVLVPFSVVEDEEDPGTTAMPGVTSVVVLLDWASGTLGMQPAGRVLAASMHFGSSLSFATVVMVSARAAPNAPSIEAARRLIVNVLRFMSFPPFWTRSVCGSRPGEAVAADGP
jgi:hypothetical protein